MNSFESTHTDFTTSFDEMVAVAQPGIRLAIERAYRRGREDEAKAHNRIVLPSDDTLPTPNQVIEAVLAVTGLVDIRKHGAQSQKLYSHERRAAAILLREMCELSYTRIAHALGYGDHTSVISAVREGAKAAKVTRIVAAAKTRLVTLLEVA